MRETFESSASFTGAQSSSPLSSLDDVGYDGRRGATSSYFGRGTMKYVSEEVEGEGVDPDVAYEVFKGKVFQSIDFSQGVPGNFLRNQMRPEYVLEHTPSLARLPSGGMLSRSASRHLENLAAGAKVQQLETPLQRLTRLQNEIMEVQEFLVAFLDSRDVGGGNPEEKRRRAREEGLRQFGADPSVLLAELAVLQRQVDGTLSDESLQKVFATHEATSARQDVFSQACVHLDKALGDLGAAPLATATIGDAVEGKALTSTTTQTTTTTTTTTQTTAAAGTAGHFSYEVYSVPSMKPLVESGRLALLEQRLADMEHRLGVKHWSEVGLPFPDLYTGLKAVANRLLLLDPNRLEALGRRVQNLTADIETLLRRREKLVGSTSGVLEDRHILEMYDTCEKWRHTATVLPVVVKRLRVLKSIHQEAASVSTRLNVLESQQSELAKLMETTTANYETLQSTVTDNLSWVRLALDDLHDAMQTVRNSHTDDSMSNSAGQVAQPKEKRRVSIVENV